MRQALAQAEDDKLEQERRRTYLGTARVRFEALHFRRKGLREPDKKHVEHLKECFRDSGCRPLEKPNHISAVISQEHLDKAIRASGIQHDHLLSNQPRGFAELEFPPGLQIDCLHGQHRILAAAEVLEPEDKWWAVDLYRTGIIRRLTYELSSELTCLLDLNPDLEIWLTEEFINEEGPADGELYCKIRQYNEQRPSLKAKWTARLKGKHGRPT